MLNKDESDKILSDIEVILPNEIIEACRTLKPNGISYFMSVNEEARTNSHVSLHKLNDESVKIRVTVTALESQQLDGEIKDEDVRKCTKFVSVRQVKRIDGVVALEGNIEKKTNVGLSDEGKRFGRRKLCIANPPVVNRLNRQQATWGAKRKTIFKKMRSRDAASLVLRVVTAREKERKKADEEEEDNGGEGGETERADEAMMMSCDQDIETSNNDHESSTVIILKTVARQPSNETTTTSEESKLDAISSTPNEDKIRSDDDRTNYGDAKEMQSAVGRRKTPSSSSRDIAERLKTRSRKGVEEGVTCDLCGETEDDYARLFRHVKVQHGDCTFVRNYLEELEPLASTPCPYCKKLFLTASGLKTHVNTTHPDESAQTLRQISKLGLQRTQLAAVSQSSAEKKRKESEEAIVPFVCNVCRKPFVDVVKYRRHVQTHGPARFQCDKCEKGFRLKENLNKHVQKVHAQKFQRHPGGGGGRTVEQTKAAMVTSSKTSSIVSPKGSSSEFRCDNCVMSFNRMSLLVTHLRYCLKSKSSGVSGISGRGGAGIMAKK